MSPRSFLLDDALQSYITAHAPAPDPVHAALIERTQMLGDRAGMQVAIEQAALLTMLVQLTGVTSAVEVGTFTGTSALSIARGLAPGGRLLCCDVSEEWTAIAREAWYDAGVEDRIDLRIAPAIETLRALPAEPTIDFAFVDADKNGYLDYYEELVPRLRPGGLLVADNTLWHGQIVEGTDDAAVALRAYNDRAASDDRVTTVILTVADGLTVSRRH